MLKKILALAAAAVLALTLTACGGNPNAKLPELTLETSTASGVSGTGEIVRTKPSGSYEDTLIGLMTYMEDGKAATRDKEKISFDNGSVVIEDGVTSFVQMSFQEIGAENGYRYQFIYHNSVVQAEFYEFAQADSLSEKGREYLAEAREKGQITVLGKQVPVVLHPSGKYMMIYTDTKDDDRNREQKEWAEELFLSFPTE